MIDPTPVPEHPGDDGVACPYQTSAVDLTLGDEILRLKKLPFPVDLKRGVFSALDDAVSERWRFPDDRPFTLTPGTLVLGKTLERIALPIPSRESGLPCLAARVEGRSSYARCGLLVHFTAPTIHAGFDGTITLEICNFGPHDILLHKHEYICQLIVEEVTGMPFRNDSRFQGQISAAGRIET